MDPLYHPTQDIPNTSGIYRIVCSVNQKLYIGSTKDLRKRRQEHFNNLRKSKHPNQLLQNAWNKYGEQAFIFEVLELVLAPFLLEREQYWLDNLKPFAPREGFNIAQSTQSNNLGMKASPETIEKLRASHIGQHGYWTGKKRPPETCEKIRAVQIGIPKPRYPGYTHSPEHREKLRQANLGKKQSEETIRKASEARRGKKRNPESVEKSRIARTGRKNTPESIKGMVNAKVKWMKTIIMTDPNGIDHTVTGIKRFCREHSLDYSTILKVLKGIYPTHKKWKARYLD